MQVDTKLWPFYFDFGQVVYLDSNKVVYFDISMVAYFVLGMVKSKAFRVCRPWSISISALAMG